MKPLEKLNKLSRYLKTLKVGFVEAMLTTNASDATERLNGASGVNIITARPELHHSGSRDSLSAVIFVLDKGLGNGRTPELESSQYDMLVPVVNQVLSDIGGAIDCECREGYLAGLTLVSYDVVPETSIFGGWLGWSIELEFE